MSYLLWDNERGASCAYLLSAAAQDGLRILCLVRCKVAARMIALGQVSTTLHCMSVRPVNIHTVRSPGETKACTVYEASSKKPKSQFL